MNRPETDYDQPLADLLRDAVAGVEPADRLADIRAGIPQRSTRRWAAVGGGSVLAVAATVTAIALATSPSPTATDRDVAVPPEPPVTTAVPAYFVGETPWGDRLYREFQPVADAVTGLTGLGLLESGPADPDYSSLWPEGSFEDHISDPEAGVVHVYLTDTAPADPSGLALQQVVYTVGAGFQEPLEVVFHRGDSVVATVPRAPQLDTLSHVNLSDPSEGQQVSGTLDVEGVANSNEANILWRLVAGGQEIGTGSFTAEGWMGEKLFPFSGEIDVSSLAPGSYTLIVETDDPSGGAEGFGPYSDSRSFVIE
jgi:hypothetical protein